MGVGFGSAALYGGVDDILNNGANPCNVSQAGFGLAGIIGGLGLIGRNARPAGQQASGIVQQIRQLWRGGGVGMADQSAHEAALSKYGVSPFSVYHYDVIRTLPEHFNDNWLRFWENQ